MSHQEAAIERRTLACGAVASRRPTQRLRALLADRVLSAPDTWERHLIVADLVGAPSDLIDVGGLPGQLARFLPDTRVLAVNVEEPRRSHRADRRAAVHRRGLRGGDKPRRPRARRCAGPLAVRARDAPRHAGALGPLLPAGLAGASRGRRGDPGVVQHGRRRRARWLTDHLSKGLPTLEELQSIYAAHGSAARFLFHGDFRDVNEQFQRLVLARHRHRPADVAGYARFRLSYRPSTDLAGEPSAFSNRVFVVTDVA